jgi:hypothetical protein
LHFTALLRNRVPADAEAFTPEAVDLDQLESVLR